ncbi:ABC transporter ATP-binding protein [Lachnospiraceae bacterium ZAX-1]
MNISVEHLSMQFKNGTKALHDVNLNIGHGVYGLLGENGAGKTTFMRILTTLLKPTDGHVKMNGISLKEENYRTIRKKIGYLPQELGLYPHLSVRETLEYIGGLNGIKQKHCKERVTYYLEKTSLIQHQKKKNKQLSGGMRRRVGLIQALLHEPEILIVDEPTTGLDPEERIRIRNLLVDFSKERTVLLSTHVVEDLSATCSHLGIMKTGSLIFHGSMSPLLDMAKGKIWMTQVKGEDEYEKLGENYVVTSRQYRDNGILVKFISENTPEIKCVSNEITLEDAYVYQMHKAEERA